MEGSLHYPLDGKPLICIRIAKIKKIKTCPLSKFILDQGHVLGNANIDPGRQICVFPFSQKPSAVPSYKRDLDRAKGQ